MIKAEQEVLITKSGDEPYFTVLCSIPSLTLLYRQISKKCGGVESKHLHYAKFLIPASELVFSAKRKLNLTAEQRAERKERFNG